MSIIPHRLLAVEGFIMYAHAEHTKKKAGFHERIQP